MNFITRFESYIEAYSLFSKDDKILVAVSGGKDSMLLLWLLHQCNYSIEIAHCNFQLRGNESDGDEDLVRSFAANNHIPIHVRKFDTNQYASEHKISIQMAARALRYNWFEELRVQLNCSVIAVAHHMNDSVETVLFNLSRGTGLSGLQGILPKRDDNLVVRPMLYLQHKEIQDFVNQQQIPYRDDSSNFSNKYARNKIRLDIIPEFEKLNPEFISIMADNISRFRDSQELLQLYMERLRSQILAPRNNDSWNIAIAELEKLSVNEVYFLLEPFGFKKNVLEDLVNSLDTESGKRFESSDYLIILDRDDVILSKRDLTQHDEIFVGEFDTQFLWGNYNFEVSTTDEVSIVKEQNVIQVDFDELIFPLSIRAWEEGDIFQPLGMQGRKKLSDYFIQKKINILDKKSVPILVNGDGRIVWVVNYHMDDRFKIRDNTQKVLKLVCNLDTI